MKMFVIENATQTIVNAILVDPQNVPDVGDGYRLSETGGNIGDVLVNGEWVTPQPDIEVLASEARAKRNALLSESDWTQVADAPVDQAAWATYRQALRDVPLQEGFPADIAWPSAPQTAPSE